MRGRLQIRVYDLVERRGFAIGCIIVGVLLRLIWALIVRPAPASDSRYYYETARSLAHGDGYLADGRATAWRPPGYSFFLSLVFRVFGSSATAGALANVVLAGITLAFLYVLVMKMTGSKVMAGLTLLLTTLHPNSIAYTSVLSSELLSLCFATAGLLILTAAEDSLPAAAAAGVVFGLAGLIRPIFLGLPVFIGVWRLVASASSRSAKSRSSSRIAVTYTLLGVAMVAVLTPWLLRNDRLFGHYVLANESGVTFLVGNNPYATGGWLYNEKVRGLVSRTGDEYADSAAAQDYALSYAAHHPWHVATLIPRKVMYLYAVDHDGAAWNLRGLRTGSRNERLAVRAVAAISDLFYWIVSLGFVAWVVARFRRRASNRLPQMAGLVLMFFTLVCLPFFGTSRFHFFVFPWIALGAAMYLDHRIAAPTSDEPHATPAPL